MYKMTRKAFIALLVISVSVQVLSLTANAQELTDPPNYNQYIKEAIEQEVSLDVGVPASSKKLAVLDDKRFNSTLDTIENNPNVSTFTKQKISKLENADVILIDIDKNGDLVSATSSKEGDIKSKFDKRQTVDVTQDTYNQNSQTVTVTKSTYGRVATNKLGVTTQSLISNQGNTSGKETGAFHRLQTPASSSNVTYNGIVADSVVLPTYNIDGAYKYKETAYFYTGIDSLAEVGFEAVTSQSTATGWYPSFHARNTHTVVSGDDNGYTPDSDNTYVYRSKKFDNGSTVNGYKVYYYTTDNTLTIREQINYSDIYVIRFTGQTSAGRSVKRVTAIAMNGNPAADSPFHYGFTTPLVWNNMRFLTNNSAGVAYPNTSAIPSLKNDVWTHGGKIDYTNNTSSHIEKYIFSVN